MLDEDVWKFQGNAVVEWEYMKFGILRQGRYFWNLCTVPLAGDWPFNPLDAELNPICHLLALLGAHHILDVSRVRVKAEVEN